MGMRDKLIHGYFGVDIKIVWEVVSRDLPDLYVKITNIKLELEKSESRMV